LEIDILYLLQYDLIVGNITGITKDGETDLQTDGLGETAVAGSV
jgi:hypothetical protein